MRVGLISSEYWIGAILTEAFNPRGMSKIKIKYSMRINQFKCKNELMKRDAIELFDIFNKSTKKIPN